MTDIPSNQTGAAPPTQPAGRALFVRQSSGLVREVSVRNALFFNAAAFIGAGVGWYPVFYALPFVAVGMVGPFSTYGWAAIITGAFCVLLGMIYASLSTVMPRSGGDYVFTSRFIPKVGPFIAWIESFTLVFASLAIIAFEVPIVLRNLQISGRIIGIGTGNSFMANANGWFTNSSGSIVGWQGLAGSLIVLAIIFWVVIQPTRRFHRIVTVLAVLGLLSAAVMFVLGLLLVHPSEVVTGLQKFAGTTPAALAKVAKANGTLGQGVNFAPAVFSLMIGVLLFQFIGFQYSSYIAGEVRGNVK
ncbi:MAG: amino acid permease, partial [Candidatus Dormibacteria bacterium]